MHQERPQVALGHIICVTSIRVQATEIEFKQNRSVVWVAVGCGTVEEIAIHMVTLLMPHPTLAHTFQSAYICLHRQFPLLKIWETMGSALGTSGRTPINRHPKAVSWSATSGQNAPRKIHGKDRSRFLGSWRHDSQANHKKSDFRSSLASRKIHPWSSEDQPCVKISSDLWITLLIWSQHQGIVRKSSLYLSSSCNENLMSSCWAHSLLLLSKSL